VLSQAFYNNKQIKDTRHTRDTQDTKATKDKNLASKL